MANPDELVVIRVTAIDDSKKGFSSVYTNLDRTKKKAVETTKAVMGTGNAVGGMGRKAGMAGIQVQQLVGQIQGGTNPMLALSQQSADLGFVLGAPLLGAVGGLAASLAMVLLPALFDADGATDSLRKQLDDLYESTKDMTQAQREFIQQSYVDQIQELESAAFDLREEKYALTNGMFAFLKSEEDVEKETKRLNAELDANEKKVQNVKEALRNLVTGQDEAAETTKKMRDSVGDLIDSLVEQADTLGMTAREEALYSLEKLKGNEIDKAIVNELYNKIEAYEAEQEAKKKAREEDKKADREKAEAAREQAAVEKMLADMRGDSFANKYGLDQHDQEIMKLKEKYETSKALIDQAYQDKVQNAQAMQELEMWHQGELGRIESERMEAAKSDFQKWMEDYEANMITMQDITMQAANTMQSAFGNAVEDVLMGTKSVDDAFKDMARTIIGQVINSLAQMAAQWVTNQIIASTLGATATATNAALGATTAAAWAPAAAMVSLASFGMNAPPAMAGIAATTAAASTASMLSFDGGGYTGDGARAGGMDGKGGFMAMLHPNETVVDHTKGQDAGGVTVVQNINISTGVQQTVRNEIASMMPQISESAKQAVLEARKRGGSFSSAFGG